MKKLILGCALAVPAMVGLLNLAYVPEAQALPPQSCDTEYYSDATYTTVVGESTLTCSGQRILWWGVKTSFTRVTYCEPC